MKGDEGGFVKRSMSILPIKRRTVLECRYPEKLSLPQHITTKHEMELHEELAKRKEENGSNTEASGGMTGTLALEERQASQAAEFSSDLTMDEITAYLSEFEEKCPPGGGDSVVIYTTSLRGIWKTFEDCRSVKFLLDSFKVVYFERDVSMDLELREEMWTVLGTESSLRGFSSEEDISEGPTRWSTYTSKAS
ncbi:hypothetical protein Nepgr_030942 [Nepenthes gracilis]|uniref:Glutaredoxin domain-containing protein n=1 Tax=Nepenthes gracilis TaxID=150966 RepID=A0AAD3Y6J9_NEPGR|nr:hypothetical protein Nepgr_030942 [Nepenthes gracilis]